MYCISYLCAEHNAEPGEPEDPELPGADGLLRADVAAVVLPAARGRGGGRRRRLGNDGGGGAVFGSGGLGVVVGQRHGILKRRSFFAPCHVNPWTRYTPKTQPFWVFSVGILNPPLFAFGDNFYNMVSTQPPFQCLPFV